MFETVLSPPMGKFRVTYEDGQEITAFSRSNLVLRVGRSHLASMLMPDFSRHIAFLQLGDCLKSANLPHLNDAGVVQEITKLDGTLGGTFAIDPVTEMFKPESARRLPIDPLLEWGSSGVISINGSGQTILTDAGVDFTTLNIQFTDIVVVNTPTVTPTMLQIKQVISATELELHNPYGYTSGGGAVQYRIETPGTQLLISKRIIAATHMPKATYGSSVIIHEASLLFNDGVAFNRVLFAPDNDDQGVLIKEADAFGVALSPRFECLITF